MKEIKQTSLSGKFSLYMGKFNPVTNILINICTSKKRKDPFPGLEAYW